MGAAFGHATVLEDHDLGRLAHRHEIVRDHDRRPPAHEPPQGTEHLLPGLDVEAGRRLVEDEDRGVPDHCPRDGDPLALSAGEQPSLLPDNVS